MRRSGRTAPAAARSLAPTAKFCSECGRAAAAGCRPRPRRRRGSPSPSAYTPRYLADQILTSQTALEGERKQVTVLFADLQGSMQLLAERDPEEARELLDPVLELMMEAVHWYEGTVNQVMGDGIMALFGAPLAQEDHALRACYAALRMQEAVRRYAKERPAMGAAVQIRIGLNSGEVVVRAIGNDLRMDYSAIGQTTHIASRMEQLAAPGRRSWPRRRRRSSRDTSAPGRSGLARSRDWPSRSSCSSWSAPSPCAPACRRGPSTSRSSSAAPRSSIG